MLSSNPRSVISLSGASEHVAALSRIRDVILANWPGACIPEVEIRPLHVALSRFEYLPSGATDDALVILQCKNPSDAQCERLIAAVDSRGLPMLVLTDMDQPSMPVSDSALCLSPATHPSQLAAACWALMERQRSVSHMAAEISLAHRCEAGIRGEMERMHEELNGAAAIQREFTTAPLPTIAGFDFGLMFRPMNFVSGDVCNVHRIDRHRFSFLVADVVGHGIPAAMLTMVLSNTLAVIERGACAVGTPSPSTILRELNARLRETSPTASKFATALYGIVDERSFTVTICSAGHPAPIVATDSGCRTLDVGGPLLGVFDEAEYEECVVTLHHGETLYVYTDGLDAALRTHEELSGLTPATRVLRMMTSIHDSSKLCGASGSTAIGDRLDSHVGSLHQEDDLTVLAIGIKAAEEVSRLAA